MCINKRWIKSPYLHREILVPCGHCPACKQAKAVSRTNRIRNHDNGSMVRLFVTLTYTNACVPYINVNEVFNTYPIGKQQLLAELRSRNVKSEIYTLWENRLQDGVLYRLAKIYRDSVVRRNRNKSDYYVKDIVNRTVVLDDFLPLDREYFDNAYLGVNCLFEEQVKFRGVIVDRTTRETLPYKVGVCLYADFQRFIKRLRQNLKRKYHYEDNISYYGCSEYGPDTCRPHFHALIDVPAKGFDDAFWKNAISEAWPYDDGSRTYENISIAVNAAAYVSSYVNSSSVVPMVLEKSITKPKHSYSQSYGMGKDYLTISSIFKAISRRDLHYTCKVNQHGTCSMRTLLLPKYSLSRYFPRFKGFGRLSASEIQNIVTRPNSIVHYASKCGLTSKDIRAIRVMLTNKRELMRRLGVRLSVYARFYSEVWTIYKSNLLIDMHKNIAAPQEYMYTFDNVVDFFRGDIDNDILEWSMNQCPPTFNFIDDPNRFPANLEQHSHLVGAYDSYSKDKRIRNYIYSQTINV